MSKLMTFLHNVLILIFAIASPVLGQIAIPAGSDLAKMKLQANSDYYAAGPIFITGTWQPPANVSIHGSKGAGIPLMVKLPPGGGSAIDCRWGSANFELCGFAISCPANCTIIEAGNATNWHDCSTETSFEEGMVARSPQAKNCTVAGIVARKPSGGRLVLVDGADGCVVRNCTSPGSTGEAVFRIIRGDDGHIAQGFIVTDNTFGYANVMRKPPLDLRTFAGGIATYNKLGAWTRVGEGQGITAAGLTYAYNVHDIEPSGIPPFQLMGGMADVDHNTFKLLGDQQSIAVGGSSKLLSSDQNIDVAIAPTTAPSTQPTTRATQ